MDQALRLKGLEQENAKLELLTVVELGELKLKAEPE